MTDSINILDLSLIALRFFCGSTFLLLSVWLLDKTNCVQNYRNKSRLWKAGLLASFVLLAPLPNLLVPVVYLDTTEVGSYFARIPTNSPTRLQQQEAGLNFSPIELLNPPGQITEIQAGDEPGLADPSNITTSDSNTEASLFSIELIFLVWILIAGTLLLRKFMIFMASRNQLRSRTDIDQQDRRCRMLLKLGQQLKIQNLPRLSHSPDLSSPVTLLGNEICLPVWTDDELPEPMLNAILAHEISHIRERDLQVQLVLHIIGSLLFFQPLLGVARKRLATLAEFIADESSAKLCNDANLVADTLVHCAERMSWRDSAIWQPAMMGSNSQLKQRIIKLTSAHKREKPASQTLEVCITGLISAIGIFLVPNINYGLAPADSLAAFPGAYTGVFEHLDVKMSPNTMVVENTVTVSGPDSFDPETAAPTPNWPPIESAEINTAPPTKNHEAEIASQKPESIGIIEGSQIVGPNDPEADSGAVVSEPSDSQSPVLPIAIQNSVDREYPLPKDESNLKSLDATTSLDSDWQEPRIESAIDGQFSELAEFKDQNFRSSASQPIPFIKTEISALNRSQIRAYIREIEKEYFQEFNNNVEASHLKVRCGSYKPAGSFISKPYCEPVFLLQARGEALQDSLIMNGSAAKLEKLYSPGQLLTRNTRPSPKIKAGFEEYAAAVQTLRAENPVFRELDETLRYLKARL